VVVNPSSRQRRFSASRPADCRDPGSAARAATAGNSHDNPWNDLTAALDRMGDLRHGARCHDVARNADHARRRTDRRTLDGRRVPFMPFPTPPYDASGALSDAGYTLVKSMRSGLPRSSNPSDDAIISNRGAECVFGHTAQEGHRQTGHHPDPPKAECNRILSRRWPRKRPRPDQSAEKSESDGTVNPKLFMWQAQSYL
jgi:hypothetical protein